MLRLFAYGLYQWRKFHVLRNGKIFTSKNKTPPKQREDEIASYTQLKSYYCSCIFSRFLKQNYFFEKSLKQF